MANILFVLPAGGYSGGANSVVQEVNGLRRIGQNAVIAVNSQNISSFKRCYSTQFELLNKLIEFRDYEDLSNKILSFDIIIATVGAHAKKLFDTVRTINSQKKLRLQLGYYIQDYEPLFFRAGSMEWEQTCASYDDAADVICFAKTDWICRVLKENHGLHVKRVLPSIDHDCFLAGAERPEKIVISAMIRPGTPRRAPHRTARVLSRFAEKYKDRTSVVSFGCDKAEIVANGILLHDAVKHYGQLTREQVAQVLRESSLFLDLSDYQAFGRTGIEAMACGAVPVMPVVGGASEFVTHRKNGYIVDTRSDDLILETIELYAKLSGQKRHLMSWYAQETASQFSIQRTSLSLLNVIVHSW